MTTRAADARAAPEPMRAVVAFAYVIGKEGEYVGLHPLNLGSRNGVTASVDYPYAGGNSARPTGRIAINQHSPYYIANVHLTVIRPNGHASNRVSQNLRDEPISTSWGTRRAKPH